MLVKTIYEDMETDRRYSDKKVFSRNEVIKFSQ